MASGFSVMTNSCAKPEVKYTRVSLSGVGIVCSRPASSVNWRCPLMSASPASERQLESTGTLPTANAAAAHVRRKALRERTLAHWRLTIRPLSSRAENEGSPLNDELGKPLREDSSLHSG